MDEWKAGDPADWGDSVGVPDIPYMGYLDDDEEDDDFRRGPRKSLAQRLCDNAWDMRQNGRYMDAKDFINRAIDEDRNNPEFYNIRAIILQDLGQFRNSLNDYNRSLRMRNSQVVRNNKARLLHKMAHDQMYHALNKERALELINEALKLTNDDFDRKEFLSRKGELMVMMGRKAESTICYMLALEKYDEVAELERQLKILKDPNETFICIAGRDLYHNDTPLKEGMIVTIDRDAQNPQAPGEILITHEGKPVGYVANSFYTLIEYAKSADEIRDTLKDGQMAKIMFKYHDGKIVAKLI